MKKTYNFKTQIKIYRITCLLIILTMLSLTTKSQVNVTASAGTLSASYATVKGAFDKINDGTHQGSINIDISANTNEGTTPANLNSSGAGSASYTSVLIRPSNDGVSISGNPATGLGIIQLNGADNVTIDGDNPNSGGTNRDLTIINTNTNTITYTSCVRIAVATTGATTASNINIKNCVLNGNATGRNVSTATSGTGSEANTFGIYAGPGSAGTTSAPSAVTSISTTVGSPAVIASLNITNCIINQVAKGIGCMGSASTVFTGLVISNNIIGSATANNATTVYKNGISLGGFDGALISGNTIQNIESYIGGSSSSIDLGLLGATTSGQNSIIENNIINGYVSRSTTTFGAFGINVSSGNNFTIRNNFICGITHDMSGGSAFSTSFGVFGIRINTGTGHKVYHNTVSLSGLMIGTATTSHLTAAFAITGSTNTNSGCDVRNNIFSNTITGGTTSIAHVSVFLPSSATSTLALTFNNNIYYCGSTAASQGIAQAGTTAGTGFYLPANFNPALTTPSTNLRAYTSTLLTGGSNDNASRGTTVAAPFVSATDLHISSWAGGTEGGDFVANKGASVGVATDIDGDARPNPSNSFPAIGADELGAPCTSNNGGTLSPAASACFGNSAITIVPSGFSTGSGISYQWYTCNADGSGPVAVIGGSGATSSSYTTPSNLAAGIYYYELGVKCNGGAEGFSTVIAVTVYSLPVTVVTPSSANYCNPGTAVGLTASGASSYTWAPSSGLNVSTGENVNASPTANTVYTVTGTTNGCSSTATASVNSLSAAVITGLSATPGSFCAGGGNSVLSVNVTPPSNSGKYIFTPSTTTYTALSGGTAVSSIQVDDAASATLPLGFSFTYLGTTYTSVIAGSNGWLSFNSAAASTSAANQRANLLATTTASSTLFPMIAPLWDDLDGSSGTASYLLGGTPGNFVFTFEWLNWKLFSGSVSFSFQVKLYQVDNHIEMIYRQEAASSTLGASIGLAGTTLGQFLSLDGSGATPNASSVTETTNISARPATGQRYSFAPPVQTYSWSPSTFLSATTGSTVNATSLTTTTVYTVTATALSGCTTSSTVTVTVGEALTCTALTTSGVACPGSQNVTAHPAGGSQPYSYAWTEDGTTIAPTTQTIVAATGTHIYNCLITDNCGNTCNAGDLNVITNANPTISITPSSATNCVPGSGVILTASGASTYSWSPAANLTPTTGSPVTANPSAITVYTVTGTDANGCVSSNTVSVSTATAVTISSVTATPSSICLNDNSALSVSASISQDYCIPGMTSVSATGDYIADFTFADITNNNTPDAANDYTYYSGLTAHVVADGTTLYNISLRAGGLSSTYAQQFRIWIDLNQNGIFEASESIFNSTSSTFSPSVTTGTATIPNTALNGTTRLRVASRFSSTPGASASCLGESQWGEFEDYNVSISGGASNPATLSYAWSPSAFLSSTTASTVNATAMTATTTYTVTATAGACSASGTVTVNVGAALSCTALTTAGAPCQGLQTITAHPVGGSGPFTYAWTEDGTSIAPTTATINASLGTHTYNCQVMDQCGLSCLSGDLVVTTNATPVVSVSPSSATNCVPGSGVTLTAGNAVTYSWSPASGLTPTSGAVVVANPSSATIYTVTGTDVNGCSATATSSITNAPAVLINSASANPVNICSGGTSQLNVDATIASTSPSYCSVSTSDLSTCINSVVINTLNSTGLTCTSHQQIIPKATATTNLTPGQVYSITITFSATLTSGQGGVYFDWDRNGTYNQTDEYFQFPGITSPQTFDITVPSGAAPGETGMRVRVRGSTFSSACEQFFSGSTKDYTIDIGSVSGASYSWSPATFLSSTTITNPVASNVTSTTVYTVVASAGGCVASSAVSVVVGAAIACNALSVSGAPCEGVQTVTANPVGGTPPYTYAWTADGGSVSNTTQNIFAATGTHTYNCQVTDACGQQCNSGNLQVTTNASPNVTATPSSGLYCLPGMGVSLTASGALDYVWTPVTGLSATTGAVVSASPSSNTTYTVTGTDANGCFSTATSVINSGNQPGFSVSPASINICTGGSTVLNVIDVFSGAFTYSSTITIPSSGTGTPYPAPLAVSGVPAGAILTSVKIDGYTHTFPGDVDVLLQSPAGTNVVIMSDVGGGTDISNVNLIFQDGSPAVPSPIAAGTYAPTNSGATDTYPAPGPGSITQATPLLSSFGSGNQNGTWNLYVNDGATPDGGTIAGWSLTFQLTSDPSVTYSWSPAAGLSETTGLTVTATPAFSTTYTVTGTNATGCSSTATSTVNVGIPLNCAALTATGPFCAGSDFTVSANPSGGSSYSYSWSDGTTTSYPNTQSITANFASAGSYNFTCIVTDICGGSCSSSLNITVNALPALSVNPASPVICNPGGSAVTLTAAGGTVYQWSPSTGLSVTTGNSVVASPAATTVYTVTGTDNNSCVSTTTTTVNISSSVTVTGVTASIPSVCSGGSSTLTANASLNSSVPYCTPNLTGGSPGATGDYLNNFTFGNITNNNSGDAASDYTYYSSLTANVVADGATVYNISLQAGGISSLYAQQFRIWIDFNQDGLFDASESVFNSTASTYSPSVTTGNTTIPNTAYNGITRMRVVSRYSSTPAATESCNHTGYGEYEDYNVLITGGTNLPPSNLTYSWSPASFLASTTGNPVTASGITSTTTWTVTATSSQGCSATGTVTVGSGIALVCSPATVSGTLCDASDFTVNAQVAGGGGPYSYAWSDGSTTSYPNSQSITANKSAGNYTFNCLVTDNCGSTCLSSVSVTVQPKPNVSVSPLNSGICLPGGTAVTLSASGGNTYVWSPAAGLNQTTGSSVSANPSASTNYTVTGTDGNGCTNTAAAGVQVGITPSDLSASVNPANICSGTITQLSSGALLPSAMTVNNYSFAAGTGASLDPMIAATTVINTGGDDTPTSTAALIGFNFMYNGNTYSKYSVSPDGWILLGNATAVSQFTNSFTSTDNLPKIFPYWDDLATGTDGWVKVFLDGSPGNYILKFEWRVTIPRNTSGATNSTFQAWLYEGSNKIEFRYGAMGPADGTATIAGGLLGTSVSNFNSITFSSNTSNSTTANNNNTGTVPASGTIYTFLPPIPVINYSWSPAAGLKPNANVQNPETPELNSTTVYTVTATNNGCSSTATVTVFIETLSCSAATYSGGTICSGTEFTVTANHTGGGAPFHYAWSDGVGGVYPDSKTIPVNLSAGAYTFDCIVTDGCGGSCLSTVTLNVLESPSVSVSPGSGNICKPGGSAVTLTASGASLYTWTPAAGLNVSTGSIVSALPAATTTYTVTGIAANGCVSTGNAAITLNSAVALSSVTATPSSVCSGNNSQLNATALCQSGVIKITEVTLYRTGTGQTPTYPVFASGEDLVEISNVSSLPVDISGYTFGDYTSNSSTAVHPYTFPSGTVIPGNGALVLCMGSGTDLPANLYYNTGGSSGSWFSGDLMGVVLKSGSSVVDAVGLNSGYVFNAATGVTALDWSGFAPSIGGFAGTIRSAAFDSNSGSDWSQASVAVPQSIGTYNGIYIVESCDLSYSWSPSSFLSSTTGNPVDVVGITSTTQYTVTASNAAGCSATGTVTVIAGAPLICSPATVSSTMCANSDFTVTAHSTGGGSVFNYSWSDGSITSYPNAATITANLPVGTYTFNCIVSDECGNSCNSSIIVTVNPNPSLSVSPSSGLICLPGGASVTLAATSNASNFAWSPSSGLSATTGATVTANPAASTTYTVSVTDANGCVNASGAVITVGANPLLTASPSSVYTCSGSSVNLNVSSSYSGSFSYSATVTIPTSGTASPYPATLAVSGVPLGAVLKSVNLNGVTHVFPSDIDILLQSPAGTNVILMSDAGSTTSISNVNLIISDGFLPIPTPVVSGTYAPTNITTPDAFASPGPGSITQAAPLLSDFGNGNMNGTWNLYVVDDFSGDAGSISGWTLNFEAPSVSGITYSWSPSGGLTATTGESVISTPLSNTIYTITGTSNVGCTGTTSATVNVVNCDDGNACTNDFADPVTGVVSHTPVNVDDGDPCTTDGCDSNTGIFHTPSCGVTLNSSIFIQGYYSGGGLMEVAGAGALFIDGVPGATATDADTVTISAMDPTSPYALVQERQGILHTDGTISVTFNSPVVAGNSYYLKLYHRNSVETWSAAPVLMSPVTSYLFSTAATQAFSGNQADLGDGNFAIFSGDINHDGAVDGSDFLELDPSIQNGDGGYAPGDLNGDGAVDGSDFLVLDPNIQNGVGAAIPTP